MISNYFRTFLWLTLFTACIIARCPKNAINGSTADACYFGININETFDGADLFCSTYFYGNLASISSETDDLKILALARAMFQGQRKAWLGGTYDGQKVQWLDGSAVSYENIAAGTQPGKIVLDLIAGNWTTVSYNAIIPYICMQRNQPEITTTTVENLTTANIITVSPVTTTSETCKNMWPCPNGWIYVDSLKSCYKKLLNLNLQQAIDACATTGAHLASIHSEEENRIVNELVANGIDLRGIEEGTLIGGRRMGLGPNDWMWTDGTPWNYTNWASHEPNFHGNDEFCLELYQDAPIWTAAYRQDRQKWNDVPCSKTIRGVLCQKAAAF